MVARVYTRVVIFIGFAILIPQLALWNSTDGLQYLSYLLLAVLASVFQVGYLSENGLVPLNALFVMISLKALSAPESFLLAALSGGAHAWGNRRKGAPSASSISFGVAIACIATGLAATVMRGLQFTNHGEVNDAVRAVLTGTTYFVGNSVPLAMREALETKTKMGHIWRERHFWMMPFYITAALLASLFDLARDKVGWQIPVLAVPLMLLFYRAYRLYMERIEDGLHHSEEMASLHLRTIEALALAIDAKDETTHDHLQRVQIYAVEVGRDMGLSRDQLEALRAASMLHDIGKLAVPEHIISKPGKLTAEEFEKMKIHPVVGAEILERVRFPYPVVPIVRSHHERWDGTGYPDGLIAGQIPIGARILAAVDTLDALASDRQYRKAIPLDQAIAIVQEEAGRSFDPKVVEILSRRYTELERLATSAHQEPLKLSRDLKIDAGAAPAAGFEVSFVAPPRSAGPAEPPDFLTRIAAARQEAHALFELAQNLGNSLSLDETLSVLGVRLKRIVPFDAMAVYIRRDSILEPEFVMGENARLFSSLRIPLGQGLSGWVAENAKPIVNGNPSVEPGYLNDPAKFSTMRSALAVPLHGVNGVVGVMALYHSDRDAFTKDHLRVLQVVSLKLSLAIENALRYRQAETTATTDFLTELPNARSLFVHLDGEIARARDNSRNLTVFVCDIDNFKQINDQYGHLEGNKLLKIVAAALRSQCREFDYVARMGGDEFVLVLPGVDAEAALDRLERMRRAAHEEARMQTGLDVSISIGSSTFPSDGADAELILAQADRAMYRAKQSSPVRLRAQQNWALWQAAHGLSQVQ